MFCPACMRRWDHIAVNDCPICGGRGLLILGPLTRRYTPGTISLAVEIALEICASNDMRARKDDYAAWLAKARHNLTVTVNRCIKAGLLAKQVTPTTSPDHLTVIAPPPVAEAPQLAHDIAVAVTGLPESPGVTHRLSAPQVAWSVVSVPVDGAAPTGFSNGRSIANVAIIADPIRPLDRDTTNPREQTRVAELLGRSMFPDPE